MTSNTPKAKHQKTRPKLDAAAVLTLLTSGCYWAWFDASIFRPTLFMPFESSPEFYSLYFTTAISSSAIALLIIGTKRIRSPQIFKVTPTNVILITLVLAGCLLTMLGASLLNPFAIFFGALITGVVCSVFLLGWARIYSHQGSRSACFYISGGITIGVLLDILIIELSPLFAAFFTVALPLVFIWFLINSYNRSSTLSGKANPFEVVDGSTSSSDDNAATDTDPAQRKLSLASIFASSHFRFFGLSFSLVSAFFLFGLAFGFMQFNTAFTSPELYPFSSDALLVSRGITSLLIFLAINFFPINIHTVFRIGILIGIAGFIAVPFLSAFTNYSLIIGFVIAIGYTTFDIITWTILSELAYSTGEDTKTVFGPGRFVVHIAIFIGFLVGLLIPLFPQTLELKEAFYTTIGYLLVIGEVLLLSENSALWMLIGSCDPSSNDAAFDKDTPENTTYSAHSITQVIEAHNLTDREAEILRYLLMGRSRPRIAQILCISENTVSSHIQHIYHKLDVHGLQQLLDRFS